MRLARAPRGCLSLRRHAHKAICFRTILDNVVPWPGCSSLSAEPHSIIEWLRLQHAIVHRLLVTHNRCLPGDIDVLRSLLLVLEIDDLPWGEVHVVEVTIAHVGG